MKSNKEPQPLHKALSSLGLGIFVFTAIWAPSDRVSLFGVDLPLATVILWVALALFVFGLAFGVVATIAARRANSRRMVEEAASTSSESVTAAVPSQPAAVAPTVNDAQ